jgi:uncharacterized RDD family membrane protein YckC
MTATAPALDALQASEPQNAAPAPGPQLEPRRPQGQLRPDHDGFEQSGPAYQPSLFRELHNGLKVVPIPTMTPVRQPAGPKRGTARPAVPRGARRGSDAQSSLDFSDVLGADAALDMQVQAVIYCDAPVALPMHRFIAAAVDASMVLISLGLFLGVFLLAGGHLAFNKQVVPMLAGMVGVLWAMYHVLWCFANGDTPGMRFAGLRVVNFDGRVADREQRGVRQAAYVLSVLSAGVGLLWALVDEENLTWHDHISKTFPTPG